MPRKSKTMNQQPITPEVFDLTMTDKAQHELDMEFLHFLEQHALINKCGYEFKSELDKSVFYDKYTESLNRIRSVFNLSPVELSKSTLERVDTDKPKAKRGRKSKKVEDPVVDLGGNVIPEEQLNRITYTIEEPEPSEPEHIKPESVTPKQLQKIMGELAKINKTLNKVINIVDAVVARL